MVVAAELVEYLYSVAEGLVTPAQRELIFAARKGLKWTAGKRLVVGGELAAAAVFGAEEQLGGKQGWMPVAETKFAF